MIFVKAAFVFLMFILIALPFIILTFESKPEILEDMLYRNIFPWWYLTFFIVCIIEIVLIIACVLWFLFINGLLDNAFWIAFIIVAIVVFKKNWYLW